MRPIDADALVLELCQQNNKPYPSSFIHDFVVKGVLRDFIVCIADAPTLDYAPVVRGEWIEGLKCSKCGQVDMTEPNFCPNCGANMMPLPEAPKEE